MATMSTFRPEDVKNKAQDAAKNAADKASDFASKASDKASEFASSASDKASELAGKASDKAREVASNLGHKAEDATSAVGGGLKSLAGTIREHAPQGGMFGSATSSVAQSLEDSGDYIQHQGLSGMANDVTSMIRKNPIPAILVGVGIGFLLARATSTRS